MKEFSTRSNILIRRTYNRPLNDEGTVFETWYETVDRVISHQTWLWERAQGFPLTNPQVAELSELRELMYSRKATTSGRTLWLGGTAVARRREASQFNCAGEEVSTVNDAVDQIWLLMQGCGVGFRGIPGILNGFMREIPEIEVVYSDATGETGEDDNVETFKDGVWTIRVGDSAEAWAKSFGKLLAGKYPADKLVFDYRSIRPAGYRLKGYGWISSGDNSIAKAQVAIAHILNRRAGNLLSRIDLLDVGNWMGTVLSSRRSAEIAFHRFGEDEWEDFATAKKLSHEELMGEVAVKNPQRSQSNNSLLFHHKPTKLELRGLFEMMLEGGGGEPGFINAVSAQKRAPWFKLLNPCAEILLGDKSFCNLVETNLAAFNGDFPALARAIYIVGRANYRQTCVDLRDGVLQDTWHELNEFLRLCGVGVTGIVRWEFQDSAPTWRTLRTLAQESVNSMADELNLPRAKAVTTIKPSGTLSKIMDTTEGIHKPLGRYIINKVNFGKHDPLVPKLLAAGYVTMANPMDEEGILVSFPVAWDDIEFEEKTLIRNGEEIVVEVNTETAIDQLERYKLVMENYVDHNCSITISYDPEEVPAIVEWLDENWDVYVGVSWLLRTDPTKTAADLGFLYLPQEVITKEEYDDYISKLAPVNLDEANSFEEIRDDECAGGACPIR